MGGGPRHRFDYHIDAPLIKSEAWWVRGAGLLLGLLPEGRWAAGRRALLLTPRAAS